MNIDRRLAESHCQADLAVVIFPVYCQNIPAVVRDFFSASWTPSTWSSSPHTAKISHGNVLWEAFKIIRGRVIAAAYVPMGHTYLDSSTQFDAQPLQPIFARIQHPRAATLTRESKHPLASFFSFLAQPVWGENLAGRELQCLQPLHGTMPHAGNRSGYHPWQLYSLPALRLPMPKIGASLSAPSHFEALFGANAM